MPRGCSKVCSLGNKKTERGHIDRKRSERDRERERQTDRQREGGREEGAKERKRARMCVYEL